jgi:hypothetical protein
MDIQLQSHLGRKYSEIKEVLQEIPELIGSIDEQLSRLERDDADKGKGKSKVSSTTDKARVAINVVLNKSKLDRLLEELIESTDELRRLRKVAKAIQHSRPSRHTSATPKAPFPKTYGLINKHSSSFYNVFVRKWTCLNANRVHSRHAAKLLLDTDASKDMDLRLILEYEATSGAMRQRYSHFISWLHLHLSTWFLSSFLFPSPG